MATSNTFFGSSSFNQHQPHHHHHSSTAAGVRTYHRSRSTGNEFFSPEFSDNYGSSGHNCPNNFWRRSLQETLPESASRNSPTKNSDDEVFHRHHQDDLFMSSSMTTSTSLTKLARKIASQRLGRNYSSGRRLPQLPLPPERRRSIDRAPSESRDERQFWAPDEDEQRKRPLLPQMVFSGFPFKPRNMYFFMDPHWTSRTPW